MRTFVPALALLLGVATAGGSSGCDKPLPDGVNPKRSIDLIIESGSGVTPRGYRLHVPSSSDDGTPVPLILSFHGRGKDGEYQENLSQFSNASYGFQGISVYPEGVPVWPLSKDCRHGVLTGCRMQKVPSNSKATLMLPNLSTT